MDIQFLPGSLPPREQRIVTDGFTAHADEQGAPQYEKASVHWIAKDDDGATIGALTAEILWDWVYIDELWVSPAHRGEGLGRRLMNLAEAFAGERQLQGLWLWTQSWQGEQFYRRLDYTEFTRFEDFPRGYARIGFRKSLA